MIEAAGFHDVVAEDRTNQVFLVSLSSFSCSLTLLDYGSNGVCFYCSYSFWKYCSGNWIRLRRTKMSFFRISQR